MHNRFLPFLIMVLLLAALPAAAQDNLLQDGGLESQYTSRARPDLNIPSAWNIWIGETPRLQDWQNLPPFASAHTEGDPAPYGGSTALMIQRGYATFTAAVYQQVSVTDGAALQASAWAYLQTCDPADGAQTCESNPDSGAEVRVGIDPTGGTNPFDSDVVWSNTANPHNTWEELTVRATAAGENVTVFLYATQVWPKAINAVYWDDARLSPASDAPPAEQQPAAPTEAPPENAGGGGDGSIRYVVQAGDTLDGIAFAHGITRAELMEYNNIADPRIVVLGQELIIRPPDPTPTPSPSPTLSADQIATMTAMPTPTRSIAPAVREAAPAPVVGGETSPLDPSNAAASLCVLMFNDVNGNRLQETGETVVSGGAIVVETADGTPAGAHTTTASDPHCFNDLTPGTYSVSATPPDGYGLTSPGSLTTRLTAGVEITVLFGVAEGVEAVVVPTPDGDLNMISAPADVDADPLTTQTEADPLRDNLGLIVLGAAGVVLIAGIGLSLMQRRRGE